MKAEPATPLAIAALVMTGAGGLICTVLVCCALGMVPLAASTVNANEPAALGVPLKTPLVALRVSPPGRVPVAILQLIGIVPLAVKVKLYALLTVPTGGAVLVMVGATVAAVIVMVSARVPEPPAFVAVIVAAKVPAVDGVPVICPVPVLMERPGGKLVAPKLVGELVAVI